MAVKDSDFSPAEPLAGSERVAILQTVGGVLQNRLATASAIAALGGGGGGGAVASVNGQTGTVVLDATAVGAVATITGTGGVTVDDTDPQNIVIAATGGGGGGLTNWSEGAPGTGYSVYFQAVGSAATINAVILPKNGGAVQFDLPDNLASGGNARGYMAFDGQMDRASANQVAQGNYSVAFGTSNRVEGSASSGIGQGNITSQNFSHSYGINNNNDGAYAMAFGQGNNNNNDQAYSFGVTNFNRTQQGFVLGAGNDLRRNGRRDSGCLYQTVLGIECETDGNYTQALGYKSSSRGRSQSQSYANGMFNEQGDAQHQHIIQRKRTSGDGSPFVLTSNGASSGGSGNLYLTDYEVLLVEGNVIATRAGGFGGPTRSWKVRFLARRLSGVGSIVLLWGGGAQTADPGSDAATSAWTLNIAANAALGSADLTFTGGEGENIYAIADLSIPNLGFSS